MRKFIKPERNQLLLLAHVSLDSVAPVGSTVRTIDELVERLDTSRIEKSYDMTAEKDTELNLAYRWLTGDRKIDHSTMGKFLSSHRRKIVEIFSQTVMVWKEHDLIDFEVLSIDSVKVRANASYKQNKNKKVLEKEKKKIEEKLERLFEEATEGGEDSEAEEAALLNRKATFFRPVHALRKAERR